MREAVRSYIEPSSLQAVNNYRSGFERVTSEKTRDSQPVIVAHRNFAKKRREEGGEEGVK